MITLWGRNNSTNVKKVLWVLEELELPYTQIEAGLHHGVNNTPEYLAMNPNGLVPMIKDDKTNSILWESNTILRYLAAEYGQGKLWIEPPAKRAQAEKWMDWANITLATRHRAILTSYIRTPPEKRDKAAIEAAQQECEQLLTILNDALATQSWFSGDVYGLGDIALAPFIYNLFNCGLNWKPHPHLERWYQQLTELPAFRKVVMIPVC